MKKEEEFLTSCSVVVWKDMCAMNQGERENQVGADRVLGIHCKLKMKLGSIGLRG
jgi:hypothetical protein